MELYVALVLCFTNLISLHIWYAIVCKYVVDVNTHGRQSSYYRFELPIYEYLYSFEFSFGAQLHYTVDCLKRVRGLG